MSRFSAMPFRKKLTLLLITSGTVAIVLMGSAIIFFSYIHKRSDLVRDISALADMIGQNCWVSIEFNIPEDAQRVLASLQYRPSIIQACILDVNGDLFAAYGTGCVMDALKVPDADPGFMFSGGSLHLHKRIYFNNRVIGTIYLCDTMQGIREDIRRDLFILSCIIAAALIALYLMAGRLQREVSTPVLGLAAVARAVSCQKNYSLRAQKYSEDELGELVDDFNAMLSAIEERNRLLEHLRDNLETVFNGMFHAVIVHDIQGRILAVNERMLGLFGISCPEQARTLTIADITASGYERLESVQDIWQKIEAGEELVFEWECLRYNSGEIFPSEVALRRIDWEGRHAVLAAVRDITDRKQAEKALQQSQSRYQSIIAVSNTGAWEYTLSENYLWCSPEYFRMMGYEPDMFPMDGSSNLKETWIDLLHPEDRDKAARCFADYLAGGSEGMYENHFRLKHKDGHWVWILSRGQTLRHPDGSLADLTVGTHIDITHRIEAEDALRTAYSELQSREEELEAANQQLLAQSRELTETNEMLKKINLTLKENEELLALALDIGNSVIWEIDLPSEMATIKRIPSQVGNLGGLVGKSYPRNFYKDSYSPQVWEDMSRALDACRQGITDIYEIESPQQKPDGTMNWIYAQGKVIKYSPSGKPLTLLGTSIDITRMKKAEEALRQSEEKYRELVESASAIIIKWDCSGRLQFFNRFAEELFGYKEEEVLGKSVLDTIVPKTDSSGRDLENMIKDIALNPEKYMSNENENITKDGRRIWVNWTNRAVRDPQGRVEAILSIGNDVTDLKRMQQDAMTSARLAAIGELAAGVAHEINNPIMGIINYAQILFDRVTKQGGDTDIPRRIMFEGERIGKIVKNLLTFSREDAEEPQPADVGEIIENAFGLMQKQFMHSGIQVRTDIAEDLPRIMALPQKVQQVFVNLMSNAKDALNEKFPGVHEDKQLNISAEAVDLPDGQFVRIVFHDFGTGIPDALLDQVCSPFFTTKPVGKGTGLGLSISHNLIKDNKGRLVFESSQGNYTKVIVDLPAVRVS